MRIEFSPLRRDGELVLERRGEALIVNGECFDFSGLPDGASLPVGAVAGDWLAGPVRRLNGALCLPVLLPHGADAPQEVVFPVPLENVPNGPIAVPGQGDKTEQEQ